MRYFFSDAQRSHVANTETVRAVLDEDHALSTKEWDLTRHYVASRYRTSIAEDEAIIADETLGPRPRVAARLLRIEKRILEGAALRGDVNFGRCT